MHKKILSFAALVATVAMPMAANAAVVNLDLAVAGQIQTQNGPVAQEALSGAVAFGPTGVAVDVSSTAVNANQLASDTIDVTQSASFLNGAASAAGSIQNNFGSVNQLAGSFAGTGPLGSYSSLSSTAANLNQASTVSITVKQH